MNVKQVSRCIKRFETFKTMMKKMTSNENLVQKQITIKRKTR
jgi:signal recognition particle GTPase